MSGRERKSHVMSKKKIPIKHIDVKKKVLKDFVYYSDNLFS